MDSQYYMSLSVEILKTKVNTNFAFIRAKLAYAVALQAICSRKGIRFDSNCIDIHHLEQLAQVPHITATSSADWIYSHAIQEIRNELAEWLDTSKAVTLFANSLLGNMSSASNPMELVSTLIRVYYEYPESKSWQDLLHKR